MTLTQLRAQITLEQNFPGDGSLAAFAGFTDEQKVHMINAALRRVVQSPSLFPSNVVNDAMILVGIGGVETPTSYTFPD